MTTEPQAAKVESTLASAADGGDPAPFLEALAETEVLLPQSEEGEAGEGEGTITLPILEQDGTSYVAAFSSEGRLREATPDVASWATVRGAELAAAWPSEELWLAINPGTEAGATLPPDAVRALAGAGSGSGGQPD